MRHGVEGPTFCTRIVPSGAFVLLRFVHERPREPAHWQRATLRRCPPPPCAHTRARASKLLRPDPCPHGRVRTESSLGACTLPMTSVIAGRAAAAGLRLYLYAWVAFGRPHVCGVRPSTAQRHGVCLCLC